MSATLNYVLARRIFYAGEDTPERFREAVDTACAPVIAVIIPSTAVGDGNLVGP